jgi:glycosyltransferase AglD
MIRIDEMKKMVEVSVFLPCYNEEKRLQSHVTQILHALQDMGKTFELVIVDDGSTDGTGRVGKILAGMYSEVMYIRYQSGPSRRENLAKAFSRARGDIIVFMDLDLSVPLSYLSRLIEGVEKGNDVAIGSRYKNVKAKRKFVRRVISGVYNTFMRLYFGSVVEDHQCGFKAFKKEVVLDLVKEMGYDGTLVRGWFWDVELLVRAQRHNLIIDEFSVEWTFGKQSSFDFGRELKMLPYVLRMRFRL